MRTLTTQEIEPLIAKQRGWTFTENKLVREWKFEDFRGAIAFVNKVAELSESMNHHPDIDIRYNRVRLGLWSHDAGGVTSRDIAMTARLDAE